MLRTAAIWMALIAMLAMIALLGWQNRSLRQDRDWLVDRANRPYLGMYVPIVETRTIEGAAVAIGRPDSDRQILFFFNHTCPYCLSSAPTVADTARLLRSEFNGRVGMLGVCDCTQAQAVEYAARQHFDFPVIAMQDERTLALYRARTVPLLMAIDREGRVRHTITDVFDSKEQVQQLVAILRGKEMPAATDNGGQAP
jgi:peroxiredoxin